MTLLANLDPELAWTVSSQRLRISQQSQGSFEQRLRRASRAPDVHRAYQPGDPIQRIDWRVYARNDSLVVRDVRDEARATVLIAIDCAATMNWPSPDIDVAKRRGIPSKFILAFRLALHLSHAHLRAGDRVIWLLWHKADIFYRVTIRTSDFLRQVFLELMNIQNETQSFVDLLLELGSGELSDLHVAADTAYLLSDGLSTNLQNVVESRPWMTLHVLSSLEQQLDWIKGDDCYFDESGRSIEFEGRTLMNEQRYQKRFTEWCEWISALALNRGGTYLQLSDRSHVEELHATIDSASVGG
jgi:hypothetical protein